MLAHHPIDVMLTATDLTAVKRLYGDTIGLDEVIESDDFVTFRCGADSRRTPGSPVTSRPARV